MADASQVHENYFDKKQSLLNEINDFLSSSNDSISKRDAGRDLLRELIKFGDLKFVEILLESESDIEYWICPGEGLKSNPIVLSMETGGLEIMKLLIDKNMVLPKLGIESGSCIHVASLKGRTHIIEYLHTLGVDIDKPDCNGYTPLYYACFANKIDTVKAIIRCGANINTRFDGICAPILKDCTLIMFACYYSFIELAHILIEHGISLESNIYGRTALHIACYKSDEYLIKLLLKKNIDMDEIDIDGTTALRHTIVKYCGGACMKLLLDGGANPNIGSYPLMLISIDYMNMDCIRYLLDAKININVEFNGITPLIAAVNRLDSDLVKLFIEYGADVNLRVRGPLKSSLDFAVVNQGPLKSPLNFAVRRGFEAIQARLVNRKIIKCLIKNGANVSNVSNDTIVLDVIRELKRESTWTTKLHHSFKKEEKLRVRALFESAIRNRHLGSIPKDVLYLICHDMNMFVPVFNDHKTV